MNLYSVYYILVYHLFYRHKIIVHPMIKIAFAKISFMFGVFFPSTRVFFWNDLRFVIAKTAARRTCLRA